MYFADQDLFDSKKYFSDNEMTCWMACLFSWTEKTPFDQYLTEEQWRQFSQLMNERNWSKDESISDCKKCNSVFSIWNRKHHCRLCGSIYCHQCASIMEIKCCYRQNLKMRICQRCFGLYSGRMQLFHELQREWLKLEGRISDCTIQNHPKLIDEKLLNLTFLDRRKSEPPVVPEQPEIEDPKSRLIQDQPIPLAPLPNNRDDGIKSVSRFSQSNRKKAQGSFITWKTCVMLVFFVFSVGVYLSQNVGAAPVHYASLLFGHDSRGISPGISPSISSGISPGISPGI